MDLANTERAFSVLSVVAAAITGVIYLVSDGAEFRGSTRLTIPQSPYRSR